MDFAGKYEIVAIFVRLVHLEYLFAFVVLFDSPEWDGLVNKIPLLLVGLLVQEFFKATQSSEIFSQLLKVSLIDQLWLFLEYAQKFSLLKNLLIYVAFFILLHC